MALTAANVTIHFGGVVTVSTMALDVQPGEIVGLIGPNGAGKTTFINCVSGTYRPNAGTVVWQGEQLIGLSPHALLRLGVARTFQNVASLHDLTVMDIVKLGSSMGVNRRRGAQLRDLFRSEKALANELAETILRPLHFLIQRLHPIYARIQEP